MVWVGNLHVHSIRCQFLITIIAVSIFYPLTKKTAVQHELTLRGATAEERVSWIELSLDFVATHAWQPGELTLGKLARRFQVFVVGLLKANRIPIRAISSLHLSEFGFNRVARSIFIRSSCSLIKYWPFCSSVPGLILASG